MREGEPKFQLRRIVTWTVGLAIAAGIIVHWHANQDRLEYFLEKKTIERPNDPSAWL